MPALVLKGVCGTEDCVGLSAGGIPLVSPWELRTFSCYLHVVLIGHI